MSTYEVEYIPMLEVAFNFLFRKGKAANGSPLNQARHDFIISCGGSCLHCGKKLTRKNSNTEHIHDRALGGPNIAENKVIMCISCNHARNKTMQTYLGSPSYWHGFPGNWDRVKNYLLWNAVTVDKGHNYGNEYPDVHKIFESEIHSDGHICAPPKSWFGRGDEPNLIQTVQKNQGGFWLRFFDNIFGYQPRGNKKIDNEPAIEIEGAVIDITNKKESSGKRKILELEHEFFEHILAALGCIEGEIKLAAFSNRFQIYLEEKGLTKQSLKEFSKSYGIPKRRNFIEIIEDYFPNDIQYRREGETIVYISKKKGNGLVNRITEEE